jgi:nicotinamide-nucleotide amidase
MTDIAGSSQWFLEGFVTYSNDAKVRRLGVPRSMLKIEGAVSGAVARAMAAGALKRSGAQLAVAVTGIAGPGGGSLEKPVGLIWFGVAQRGQNVASEHQLFPGDRTAIRAAAVAHALAMIRARL